MYVCSNITAAIAYIFYTHPQICRNGMPKVLETYSNDVYVTVYAATDPKDTIITITKFLQSRATKQT